MVSNTGRSIEMMSPTQKSALLGLQYVMPNTATHENMLQNNAYINIANPFTLAEWNNMPMVINAIAKRTTNRIDLFICFY